MNREAEISVIQQKNPNFCKRLRQFRKLFSFIETFVVFDLCYIVISLACDDKSAGTPSLIRPSLSSFHYICPHIYFHPQCQATACALEALCSYLYQGSIQSLVKGLLCGQLHLFGLNYKNLLIYQTQSYKYFKE